MAYLSFNPKISQYDDYLQEEIKQTLFNSLIALLSTPKGSHPYDPNFGVSVRSYILETDTGQITSLLEADVTTAIQNYIPELSSITKVIAERMYNKSGMGYVYKLKIVISNVIVDFDVLKSGKLMYIASHR